MLRGHGFLVVRGRHALYYFFFNDTATTEIYTLSLHDALPISKALRGELVAVLAAALCGGAGAGADLDRSEEHTSELQSLTNLVCRLLLEKKKKRVADRAIVGRVVCLDENVSLAVIHARPKQLE